jgi:ATP-dependent RNA helicase HelY
VLEADVSAGDFVRNIKVLIDLLRQIAQIAPNAATRSAADGAARSLGRGVVATSSDLAAYDDGVSGQQ